MTVIDLMLMILSIFKWKVDSAAIIDYHVGKNPDSRTIKTLNKNGITSYTHKVRQVDVILVQYPQNANHVA